MDPVSRHLSGALWSGARGRASPCSALSAPSFAPLYCRALSVAPKFAGCRPSPVALHPLWHFASAAVPSAQPVACLAQPAEGRLLAQEHHRFDYGKPCWDAEDGDVEDAEGITGFDAGGVADGADSFEEEVVVLECTVFDGADALVDNCDGRRLVDVLRGEVDARIDGHFAEQRFAEARGVGEGDHALAEHWDQESACLFARTWKREFQCFDEFVGCQAADVDA